GTGSVQRSRRRANGSTKLRARQADAVVADLAAQDGVRADGANDAEAAGLAEETAPGRAELLDQHLRARERGEVGPDRVRVLVDPERLLALLRGSLVAPAE